MKYSGMKFLILGGVPMLMEMCQYVQSQGAYVIVADYYENSPCKKVADEAWLISTADTDLLAEKCLEAGVDGVLSGFDDFNIRCCSLLSERINKPFYASVDQVNWTMDKKNFKELCLKNNVPTTQPLVLGDKKYAEIEFPVIVKPVDGSGNRGISICQNDEDLEAALEYANKISKKKNVLIEKYYVGSEVGVNYCLQDGKMSVSAMHDRYMIKGDGVHPRLPLAYIYPSKYLEDYLANEDQLVQDMFRSIDMKNGTLFLQGCVDNTTVHFYEMGYRLNGAKQYQIITQECEVNPMHGIVNYSLKGTMNDDFNMVDKIDPRFKNYYCTLSVLVRPSTVGKIVGIDELQKKDNLVITQWLREGDVLEESALGTQKQIAVRVTIKAPGIDELADEIKNVYNTLEFYDTDGNDIMMELFDTNLLYEK